MQENLMYTIITNSEEKVALNPARFHDHEKTPRYHSYLEKEPSLLWCKLCVQYVPQPVDNTVTVVETTVVLRVLSAVCE